MRKFFIMSSALSLLATAGLLDQARADDGNPYTPEPAASTETSDHGQGTYCRIGNTIFAWTCDQALSTGGGSGGPYHDPTSAEKQAYGATHQPPKADNCGGGWGESKGEHGFRKS